MASLPTLSEVLTNARPELVTGKALLALDLQAEFLSSTGKLPVTLLDGFRTNFAALVPVFRQTGQVIWVRTEYSETQDVSGDATLVLDQQDHADEPNPSLELEAEDDDSEDEFIRTVLHGESSPLGNRPSALRTADLLRRAASRKLSQPRKAPAASPLNELFLAEQSDASHQCCLPQSDGAQLSTLASSLREASDFVLLKQSYSAFNSTNLLMALRLRMITKLYLCGSLTNVSVFATATDAVGHGFQVTIIDDCLGYRNKDAHSRALKHMTKIIGALRITASSLALELGATSRPNAYPEEPPSAQDAPDSAPIFQMQSLSIDQNNLHTSAYPRPLPGSVTRTSGLAETPQPDSNCNAQSYPTSPLRNGTRTASQATNGAAVMPQDSESTSHTIKEAGDAIGEGDSKVVYDILPKAQSDIFLGLKNEVHWQKMLHASGPVPRLVCVQGDFEQDGSMPVYRHPSDQSLPLLKVSSVVRSIRQEVEKIVGHSMNHVLIQLYRSGEDYISEHSDKTLDIVRGSSIVNVSIGAQRTMRLRTKRPPKEQQVYEHKTTRKTELVPLPHGSMFVLGPQTNMGWLHGINHDKRQLGQRSDAEKAYGGERISLTFRQIGTYLDSSEQRIWGQGACAKSQADSRPVVNGDPAATQLVINAFGYENQHTSFDWEAVYGTGFDVLHFSEPPVETLLFFPSGNYVEDMRVKIFLEELSLPYRIAGVTQQEAGTGYKPSVCLRDIDPLKTQVYGDAPILVYLALRDRDRSASEASIANSCSKLWELRDVISVTSPEASLTKLESDLDGQRYIAGDDFSIADCACWPVVDDILETWDPWNPKYYPNVAAYHERMLSRPSVSLATWSDAVE